MMVQADAPASNINQENKGKPSPVVEKIFEEDEMVLVKVEKGWQAEVLLEQRGIFFLKDIVKLLGLESTKVIKKARELESQGTDTWQVMGVRKVWNHWAVRMTVFAPFYEKYLRSRVKPVDKTWDSNVLLNQKGLFLLSEVCQLIPFSTYQIRYQAKQNDNAEKEYGIWKDTNINRFVVDMEIFARWIRNLWEGNYHRG